MNKTPTPEEILSMSKEERERLPSCSFDKTKVRPEKNEYCSDCKDCEYCTNCHSCTDCSFCTNCSGCTNCTDCLHCTSCKNCKNCWMCWNCMGISNGASLQYVAYGALLTEEQWAKLILKIQEEKNQ